MEQIKIKKRISGLICLAMSVIIAITLCGCAADTVAEYKIPQDLTLVNDELIAENGDMQLYWETEYQFGYAKNKKTGETVSPVPLDFLKSGEYNGNILSPISVEYYNITDTFIQTDAGYYCVEDGNFSSEKTENGVKATYYFSESEITVSLNYELRDNCLYLFADSKDIYETGKTKILKISIAPYFCSVKNTDSKNDYLFVPSGSGALMYTSDDVKGTAREFSADVYGNNLARTVLDNVGNQESVYMPVYGAKNGNGICVGIVSSGDSTCGIYARSGDVANGYSSVYPAFTVRDYQNIEWDTGKEKNGKKMFLDTVLINEKIPSDKTYGVNLYSEQRENPDYLDMADIYKNYLKENNLLENSEKITADYNLEILGGVSLKKYTLGVPHRELSVMTDFDGARKIVTELSETLGIPNLILSGFGKTGLSDDEIGDSFKISSKFGKAKTLLDYAEDKGVNVAFNLNLLTYTKSGNGFNFTFDAAKAANGENIYFYPQKVNVRTDNENFNFSHVLGIGKLNGATEKAVKFLNKYKLGFYSENLGSAVYSDCSDKAGMLGGSLGETVKSIDNIRKNCSVTVLSKANAYCAGLTDAVTDAPVSNGDYQSLDERVPFYEYVFGEYTRLYGPSLNTCNDGAGVLLKCIESGVYPSFTVAENVDVSLIDSDKNYLYSCNYSGNKDYIQSVISQNADFYSRIKGAHIAEHSILKSGVTSTVFSNGVTVIVNHTESDYSYNGKTVKAYSYTVESKGVNE